MALDSYKTAFDNAYEEIFMKVLVALKICNLRFEKDLKYGSSIQRALPNIDSVRVRDVTRGTASTVDSITDSTETLTISREKEAVFTISDGEVTQCGPLNPGEYFGGHIAKKVAADLDGWIFYEVLNAAQTFDTGDLTTLSSTGVGVALTSTSIPQMVTRMPAKLLKGTNQVLANMAFVIDSYAAADIAQYLLGKQFDVVESVFKNGYAGNIATAEVYVSENLTSTVTLTLAGTMTASGALPYITINGVSFRLQSNGTPAAAGDISCVSNGNLTGEAADNLVLALNDPYTSVSGKYYAIGETSAAVLAGGAGLSATNSSGTITIKALGGGRLAVAENVSGGSFSTPYLHCYYGKKGAIDVVVQDLAPVDMRKRADLRGTNVFSSYLAGKKTFTDGSKKFLDVLIRENA